MHPFLARYLNLEAAADILRREDQGEPLRADERPYAQTARAFPDLRAQVLSARGKKQPSSEVQEALVFLAAHAAAETLGDDPLLAEPVKQARAAMEAEGASGAEIHQLLASLVLEEAFGYDSEADELDRPFLEETLRGVPELAKLTQERVRALYESFAAQAHEGDEGTYRTAVQALFEAAWESGPEPINPEHVQEALATLEVKLPEKDQAHGPDALVELLRLLHHEKLVGPERLRRLEAVVHEASLPNGNQTDSLI
jgi:hypothetical protein